MALQARELEPAAFDMTPMIDIAFQLIIFFMLTLDMAQQEIESVTLPPASQAGRDEHPDPARLVVNVVHADLPCVAYDRSRPCRAAGHWVVKVHGKVCSREVLAAALHRAASSHAGTQGSSASELPLMVRGDERAPFGSIHQVLREAARQRIWRVEFGARIDDLY